MDKKKGYVVTHTHWDREWRYPIWQNRIFLVELMDTLIEIFEKVPEYDSFMMDGQSVIIEDYLEVKPEMRQKIEKLIKEGKIVIGPWYTLPDLYPLKGESLVRNLQKGIRYSNSLGGHLNVGYNSFGWGQTAQFPQIYDQFGFDFIVAAKNISKQRAPKSEFLWESPDGTRVLTSRLGTHKRANFFMSSYIEIMYGLNYSSKDYKMEWNKTGQVCHDASVENAYKDYFMIENKGYIHDELVRDAVEKSWESMNESLMKDERLIMNGSDFSTPQPMLCEILKKANEKMDDKEYVTSSLDKYKDILLSKIDKDKLTVVKGELRDGPASSTSGNALATRSYIKRLNKKVENTIFNQSEPLSVMNYMTGGIYQNGFLQKGIKYMLLSHPHDSINGVTQDKTADDTVYNLNQALEIGQVIADKSIMDLVKKINTKDVDDEEMLLVCFNTLPLKRSETIEAVVDFPSELSVWEFEVLDMNGNILESQFISRQEKNVPVHDFNCRPWPFSVDRYHFVFESGEIPPGGYKVFRIKPLEHFKRETVFWRDMRKSEGNDIAVSSTEMENDFIKVNINQNGTVNIEDKNTNKKYTNLNYFEDTGDEGDYWVHYPPYNNKVYTSKTNSCICYIEKNGPISATITVELEMKIPKHGKVADKGFVGESKRSDEITTLPIKIKYTLNKKSQKLDVNLEIDNKASDHRLRVMFDTGISANVACSEGHFNVDERPITPIKDEDGKYYPEMQTLPMQGFVDVSDGENGFSVINDCLSEYEAMDNSERTLAITLFRSVKNIICTEYRAAGIFEDQHGGQSLGKQIYNYSILIHKGNWEKGNVFNETLKFNSPLKIMQTSKSENGTLPMEMSFYSVESDKLVMTAYKKAEDDDSYILRLFNPGYKTVKSNVFTYEKFSGVYLTNMNEDIIKKIDSYDSNRFEIVVPQKKIITIKMVKKGI